MATITVTWSAINARPAVTIEVTIADARMLDMLDALKSLDDEQTPSDTPPAQINYTQYRRVLTRRWVAQMRADANRQRLRIAQNAAAAAVSVTSIDSDESPEV